MNNINNIENKNGSNIELTEKEILKINLKNAVNNINSKNVSSLALVVKIRNELSKLTGNLN